MNPAFERIVDRPTDMLERQLAANRAAARGRDKHGRKLFCHLMPYRPYFVREMLLMRWELKRRVWRKQTTQPKGALNDRG